MSDPKALRLFLDVLSDAVLVLDRSARLWFANTAAMRLLPCEPGTALTELAPQLGTRLVQAATQVVTKGLPRLQGARPAPGAQPVLPEVIEFPDGRRFDVALNPFGGDRWALRLAVLPAGGAQHAAPSPPIPSEGARPAAAWTADQSHDGEIPQPVQQLRELFRDLPFPATFQDADFRLVQVNAAYLEFTGFTAEQLIGRDPIDLQPPEDREPRLAWRRQLQEGQIGGTLMGERLLDVDGRERWFRAAWRRWTDISGNTLYLTVMQDNTAEHAARENADRSARELDDWFDLSPVGMVLYDDQGLLLRCNPAFEALAGQAPVLMSQASDGIQQLLGWSGEKPVHALQPHASPSEWEAWVGQPQGGVRRLRSAVRCYRTPGGQLRYMAVVQDRSVEEERDLAQMQIGALMDTAGIGLATFQESSGWVQHSSALPTDTTETLPPSSAALQSIRRDVVLPESMPEFERLQQALRNFDRAEVRYAIRHEELGPRWLQTRVEPALLASGKRTSSVVTLDITEQHLAQQRGERLLREMSTILESTTTGIAYLRDGLLVRCNSRFESLLGFSSGAVLGNTLEQLLRGRPEADQLVSEIRHAIAGGEAYENVLAIDMPGRPRQWCALSVRRVGAENGAPEMIVALSDITRLKEQQIELESLLRDRELMFSLSDVGFAFIMQDRVQRGNEALSQLTGYEAAELENMPTSQLFINDAEYERLRRISFSNMRHHGQWSGERQLRRKDGSLLWVQVSARAVTNGDPEAGVIASYVNVDDRHRAQQAIGLQAERTRAILDSVLVGIVTVGAGGIEWMNRSARRMFGGDLADFVGRPISIVATPDPAHPFRQTQYLDDLIEGQAETFECRVQARDGREFWVVGNAVVTGREATGRQLTYALLDIERRRQAEARTAEAQSSLRRIIEAAPLAITLCDAQSLRILQINEVAAQSVESTPDQLIGRNPEDIFSPQGAAQRRADIGDAIAAGRVVQREYRVKTYGEPHIWDARYLPLAEPGQPPDQVLLVATDVTEQRTAQEARFEAAIAQRERVVKEVHHRIKNNLQGVAGLLQQIGARKPEMASSMAEVVAQVQAIAQVYGLQVGVSEPLRVRRVLEAITGSVQRTFGSNVEFIVDGPHPHVWALPEAESIPIALTVNELLTNAIKHGRADSDALVRCRLDCSDTGVSIAVFNRGELPADFSLARFPGGVSGLGLVRALLPRRSATLTVVQQGEDVVATIALAPPGVTRLDPV